MISLADWLPPTVVGATFTLLGLLKLYGLWKGVVGGADKPFATKLCGTCPTWASRSLRLGLPLLFLMIGLGNLGWLVWVIWSGTQYP